ncbi:MAG: GntR family transcriptional regulator [Propioniciclava sp.]
MPPALRSVALGEQLADILRQQIVTGQLPVSHRLVEDALAVQHGISRGPVRDALRTLTAEGLLESRQRGFFVKAFTHQDIDELYDIREAAEHLASRLALARAQPMDWVEAERQVALMLAGADHRTERAYARADLAFHTQFYVLSGSARLLTLWHQFRPTFATLLDITNAQDADLHPSATDHAELLALAKAADGEAFAAKLTEHLAGSRRRMRAALGSAEL